MLWLPDVDLHQPIARLPMLERLAARGDWSRFSMTASDFAGACFEAFALALPPGQDTPAAAVSALADGLPVLPGEYWLRMDPVCLVPQQAHLLLMDARHFPVTQDEATALLASLQANFQDQSWDCFAPHPTRWYLRLKQAAQIRTVSLPEACGRSVDAMLPQGDQSRFWHGVLNEMQMLLHQHPVNQAREEQGLLPINSVWFWGGGVLPARSTSIPWQTCYGDMFTLQAAAHYARVPLQANADGCPQPGSLTVLAGTLAEMQQTAAFEALLERLVTTLKTAQVECLHVLFGAQDGLFLSLHKHCLRRWWRLAKPLQATHICTQSLRGWQSLFVAD